MRRKAKPRFKSIYQRGEYYLSLLIAWVEEQAYHMERYNNRKG